MMSLNCLKPRAFAALCIGASAASLMGCQSHHSARTESGPQTTVAPSAKPAESPSTKPAVAEKVPAAVRPTIRIDAGASEAVTDAQGVKWSADTGFEGGEAQDRPDLAVTGTSTPELYRTERYGMDSYTFKVPNGDYTVKLHFSEDYDGITSEDDRKFTYEVKDGTATGKSVKKVASFSPWKAAGAQFKAYIDTIPVSVTAGQITITFTPEVENTQINALEIVPR